MMKYKNGDLKSDLYDIANVFADFYEELYSDVRSERTTTEFSEENTIPFTKEEVQAQLKNLKNGKSADAKGIICEMLKHGGGELASLLADMFTDILSPSSKCPQNWRETTIKVLFKKGNAVVPENYRPICIIPILYKLFSKLIGARITKQLDREQTPDQAGFRSGFSCDDDLFTITLLAEICLEMQSPLWIAALDFKKAFDSVKHESIWQALAEQKVPKVYIATLQKLYKEQSAQVKCCK